MGVHTKALQFKNIPGWPTFLFPDARLDMVLSVFGPGIPVFGPACLDSVSLKEVIDIGKCCNLKTRKPSLETKELQLEYVKRCLNIAKKYLILTLVMI